VKIDVLAGKITLVNERRRVNVPKTDRYWKYGKSALEEALVEGALEVLRSGFGGRNMRHGSSLLGRQLLR